MADPLLQDPVGGQANGVFDPFAFEIVVNLRIGEAGKEAIATLENLHTPHDFACSRAPRALAKMLNRPMIARFKKGDWLDLGALLAEAGPVAAGGADASKNLAGRHSGTLIAQCL